MGYETVLCRVLSADSATRSVKLEPLNSPYLNTIHVNAGSGLKFASTYAPFPYMALKDDRKISNVPMGFVNYPMEGDFVLALVWLTDIAAIDTIRPLIVQHPEMEVIILAKVNWVHPFIGTNDNILGDNSGAKLHFNHGWLDLINVGKDVNTDKTIQLRTGHTTLVGNRLVTLSGQKFLPFGIFSHMLGKEGKNRKQTTITDEMNETHQWHKIFTQDPTKPVYDDLLSKFPTGSNKFLEPPCPEPGSRMDMHDSGYKMLVERNGHVRKYLPRGGIIIIGDDDSDTYKKMAFDPQSEPTEKNPGVMELRFYNADKLITILVDAESDKVEIITDAGPAITIDGPTDVVEFEMAGGLTFTIDGGANKITTDASAGFEFTGDLKVTGSIEATTTVKAGTKVITPVVEGP